MQEKWLQGKKHHVKIFTVLRFELEHFFLDMETICFSTFNHDLYGPIPFNMIQKTGYFTKLPNNIPYRTVSSDFYFFIIKSSLLKSSFNHNFIMDKRNRL